MTPAERRMLEALVAHGPGTATQLGEWLYCRREKHQTRKPQHYCRPAARMLWRLLHLGFACRYISTARSARWSLTWRGKQAVAELAQ